MGAEAWGEVVGTRVAFRMPNVLHAVVDGQTNEGQVHCQGQAWDLPRIGPSTRSGQVKTIRVRQTAEVFDDHEHPGITFPAYR
eukprot:3522555-Alexandrium_andersonii.AAC.1